MAIDSKANLLAAARATHFARLMLLLEGAWVYQRIVVYYGWHLDALYFLLFLIDFIPFLMFWILRPMWEFYTRVIGLLWVIMLMTLLLPIGVGIGLLAVFCIQFLVLVWPRQYVSAISVDSAPELEITNDTGSSFRIRCIYCKATYSYKQDSVLNGEIICQNCGKVQKV